MLTRKVRIGVAAGVFFGWLGTVAGAGCASSTQHPPPVQTADEGLIPPIYEGDGALLTDGPFVNDAGTDTNAPSIDAGFDAPLDGADGGG
jgi:hypothetical protein